MPNVRSPAVPPSDGRSDRAKRRELAGLAIAGLLALHAGLAIGVNTPLSENDKARWNTVWSLVELGTYEIFPDDPKTPESKAAALAAAEGGGLKETQYGTIDKVRIDGKHYSSKPPLLPTVLSWIVMPFRALGPEFSRASATDPFNAKVTPAERYFKIALLALYLPLAGAFLLLFERWLAGAAATDFAYWFCLFAAGAGTLVTGYAGSLNNHVVAAWSAGIATLLLWPTLAGERPASIGRFFLVGLFAAWTAANELPAGLFALLALALAFRACSVSTLLGFVPAAALVAAAFFWTNVASFGTLAPAYTKAEFYDYPNSYWTLANAGKRSKIDALSLPDETGRFVEGPKVPLGFSIGGKPAGVFLSPAYLWHITFGHHGWFSLTPIWLLSLYGARHSRGLRRAPAAILGLSAALLAFYWMGNTERNYGGYCHGMRWLIWLTPLWLLLLPPALDRLSLHAWGRRLAAACLAVSVLTAAAAAPNSWSVSWLHRLTILCGGVAY